MSVKALYIEYIQMQKEEQEKKRKEKGKRIFRHLISLDMLVRQIVPIAAVNML